MARSPVVLAVRHPLGLISGASSALLVAAGLAIGPAPSAAPSEAPAQGRIPPPDDEPMRSHAAPVASYTLEASLDPTAHTVKGKGVIRWRNASTEPARELFLHLYMNAFKSDRTVFMRFPGTEGFRGVGAPAEWGSTTIERLARRDESSADLWPGAEKTSPGEPDDETDARVPLPSPVAPGETIELDVEFTTRLPSLVFRTGFSGGFNFVAQWFPKIARREADGSWAHFAFHHLSEFYADFGAYDVTVEAPSDMIIGATGELVGKVEAGGRTRSHFVQADVHDFAFTAWTQFRELSADAGGVAVRVLYPPGFDEDARVELASVRFGLTHFGRAYGAYPYKTLTVVHPPDGADEAGGMEYPTLITTGGPWFMPWTGVHLIEVVTIHELGHQWFYGLVATNENLSPFLDEGINSYAEIDAMESMVPGRSGAGIFGLGVSIAAVSRVGSSEAARNAPVAQPAPAFANGRDYGGLVYRRTSIILTTLANVYGQDLVRAAIGRYTRRFRFAHPTTDDFVAVFAEVVGAEAAAMLRAALEDRATVDYAVSDIGSVPDSAAGGHRGSVLVRRRGELRFPVDVDFYAQDGTVKRVRWDARESSARLSYEGASPLVAAAIDPEHKVLLDDDLSNNARRLSSSRMSGAVLDRASFVSEALFSAILP